MEGLGNEVKERRVENEEIEEKMGMEKGWIERRKGIRWSRWEMKEEKMRKIDEREEDMEMRDEGIERRDIEMKMIEK